MGDDSWVGQLYIVIFTIWELGINRTIYVAVESARQLCYSNEPSMVLIMGGEGWGDERVCESIRVHAGRLAPSSGGLDTSSGIWAWPAGPRALDRGKLALPSVACWVSWAG